MHMQRGRHISLSLPRRLIGDMLHFARKIPTVPVQRRMQLAALAQARALASPRPSWCAIFTKAYAQVCARRPELRRVFLSMPWPHLFEYSLNVATIAVERRFGDEDAVFLAPLQQPERLTLSVIDERLRRCKEDPLDEVGALRRYLRMGALPQPLRRFMLWLALNCFPLHRAAMLGTYGISVYASLGASSLHPLSILTTTLNYGVLEPDGSIDVRIVYDHRVMDGATIARALADLEETLAGSLVSEVEALNSDRQKQALTRIRA